MLDKEKISRVTIDHKKLKQYRGDKKQSDIGNILGISGQQISNIEKGIKKPSADRLLRLMLIYNIKPEDIAIIK